MTSEQIARVRSEVEFSIKCEKEDIPIEGNVWAMGGNADDDLAAEALVRSGLESGNPWAWCCVKVTAKWRELEASDYLGACTYESEAEFYAEGGYFQDMQSEALATLLDLIENVQI
ncbi:hypothetical protein LCGC14_0674180 [marine sediment metagenome]|uniref:Uncharacterized protein n=1 Tax=marine sediment metagenome TaxID=412755 RepID=A0A0F9TBM1_9ZZZZ